MSSHFASDIIEYMIFGIALVIPGILTVWNIYNCVAEKTKLEKLISSLTVFIGGFFYLVLSLIEFDQAAEWSVPVYETQYHYSISAHYDLIGFIVFFGFVGYFILLFVRGDKMPPLLSAVSISLLILMNVLQIVYAIQISKNVDAMGYLFYLYHANILLLSARVVHRHMKEVVALFRSRVEADGDHKITGSFFKVLNTLSKYSIFIIVVLFFVIALIEVIFVLLGQGLDAPVKAFTETADWTFSKQIPPPPIEYDGHYLCTVAAGGHKKVVKPLRLGTRRHETIVVNRQLCIANAFEELIQERMPRFHKKIRAFYDTHGYPLSRKITTPFRADIIYIVMKPLEWIFLLVLYAFDLRPEQRIARQYRYIDR